MKISGFTKKVLAASILAATAASTHAVTVAEFTDGSYDSGAIPLNYLNIGRSFTTDSASNYDNLSFSFLNGTGASALTQGRTLYLLSQAYSGTSEALSSLTSGFIASASSTDTGTSWTFNSGISVTASTEYWVYTQRGTNTGNQYFSVGLEEYGANVNPRGGYSYFVTATAASTTPNTVSSFYEDSDVIFKYRLTSTPPVVTAVPEPSEWAMMLAGLGVLGVAVQRRKAQMAAV